MKAETYQAAHAELMELLTGYDKRTFPERAVFDDPDGGPMKFTMWELDAFLDSLSKAVRMPVDKVIGWIKDYGYEAKVQGYSYLLIEIPHKMSSSGTED